MIALPPSSIGGANATSNEPLLTKTTRSWGGSGKVSAGTTVFDAAEGGPVPTEFVAVTLHRYVRPLVSPFTMIGLPVADPEPRVPPSDDVHDAV